MPEANFSFRINRKVGPGPDRGLYVSKKNLHVLPDMEKLFKAANVLEKQELLRMGFDNKLYY
jgi:hypothetical protein